MMRLAFRWILTLATVSAVIAEPGQAQARPRLVVLITVDQMRPDYFTRWPNQLTGGLHKLYSEGAVFTEAYQDHGITETAPGHSTLLSGRFPRSTGIVRNVAGVQDPQFPIVGGGRAPGASPFRFRGGSLIDWMRNADPGSRALSVSRKDRGAILPLGRARQSAFWYALDGRFSTSRFYGDTLPTWVQAFNARRTVQRLAGESWTLLLPESAYPEPDSVPAEAGGTGFQFPHRLPQDSAGAAEQVMSTPWSDQMTLDLALEGVRAMSLGDGASTDLLAVSLSATDAVGHRYGPDSREIHDQVLRLDRMLGAFLDSLEVLRGPDVVIALSADHGVTPFPEVATPADAPAHYLPRAAFRHQAAELARALGLDSTALSFEYGIVLYDPAAFARGGVDPVPALQAFVRFAASQPGIQRADLLRDLAADSAATIPRRWLHMFPPDLPVGAVVTQRPGYVWSRPGSAHHGSPHESDAHVPLIFYGEGIRPGRYDRPVRTVDIAPTFAALLGITPMEPLDGRPLREALR